MNIPPARMVRAVTYASQSMLGLPKPSCGPPKSSACPVALRAGATSQALPPQRRKTPKRRLRRSASRRMRSAAASPRRTVAGGRLCTKSSWAARGDRASASAGAGPKRSAARGERRRDGQGGGERDGGRAVAHGIDRAGRRDRGRGLRIVEPAHVLEDIARSLGGRLARRRADLRERRREVVEERSLPELTTATAAELAGEKRRDRGHVG